MGFFSTLGAAEIARHQRIPGEEVTVLDIVESLDGETRPVRCSVDDRSIKRCAAVLDKQGLE